MAERSPIGFLLRLLVVLVLVGAVAGCASGSDIAEPAPPPGTAGGPTAVYVAIGGLETLNSDRDDIQDNWPQIVFAEALPRGAVYVNLATENATVRSAVDDQLPQAEALRPTVATVWVEAADTRLGTSPASYRTELAQLVGGMQAAGATRVLLLTSGSSSSDLAGAFADSVAHVATDTGAVFVDLGDTSGRAGDPGQRRIADAVMAAMGPG